MTEQEERQKSIEYLIKKIEQLEKDLIAAEEHRKRSLKVAYNEGYAIGYKDHANLINMLNK
jgi:hypothetical protein